MHFFSYARMCASSLAIIHRSASSLTITHMLPLSRSQECFHSRSHLTPPLTPYSLCLDSRAIRDWVGTLRIQVPGRCKEHHVYPLILRSYRLELQCLYHHTQSACFSTLAHLPPCTCPSLVLADLLVSH
jgi:hypothetical protein